MKKFGGPMLYVFLMKPFKQRNFEKLQVFLAEFFHKKNYRFSMETNQN